MCLRRLQTALLPLPQVFVPPAAATLNARRGAGDSRQCCPHPKPYGDGWPNSDVPSGGRQNESPHPPMLPCPKWPLVPPPPPFCSRTRESPAPWRGAGRLQVGLAGEWPGPSGAARGQDGGCRWRPVAAWPHHPPPIAAIPAPAASRPPSRCASAPQRGGAGLILGPGGADGGNGLGWLQSRSA